MKQINYKLAIARTFPAHHPRRGEETGFANKIYNALYNVAAEKKLHTIRSNYELWAKRFKKIEAGEAVLTLFEWSGKPYKSKHRDLVTLTREHGIGLQCVELFKPKSKGFLLGHVLHSNDLSGIGSIKDICKNDGLTIQDFEDWFQLDSDGTTGHLALIHFTKFRY